MITPDDTATFWFLARMSLECQLFPPFAVIEIVLLTALIYFAHQKRRLLPEYGLQIFVLGLFFACCYLMVLVIATLGSNSANPALRQPVMPAAANSLTAIFWSSIAVSIYAGWRLRTVRSFATAFVLLSCWLLQSAFFVAGMSISGEWL